MKLLELFKLYGPNRRCEQTAIEVWLRLTPDESRRFEARAGAHQSRIIERLAEAGVDITPDHPLKAALEGAGVRQYAALLARIALALQQHAGHLVAFQATYPASDPDVCCLVVEYEHGDAGVESIRLAIRLLEEEIPEILLGEEEDKSQQAFSESLGDYLQAAPAQRLPRQSQDIIDAATRLDIPVVKLDRDPYEGLSGECRICLNGMLKLGHGCRQRVIDGTFPVDSHEMLAAMARDHAAMRQALESLGAPLPPARICTTTRQAVRAAQEIGYPIVIRPRSIIRTGQTDASREPLGDRTAVTEAARTLIKTSPGLIVEAPAPGRVYMAILAGGDLVAVLEVRKGVAAADVSPAIPGETRDWLTGLIGRLGVPMMTVIWAGTDLAEPLVKSARFLDLDVAPSLDGVLPGSGPLPADHIRERAAEGLVRHLFPNGTPARIPIVSVTGTNGKSTVCAMIARIMQEAGHRVGRAGTTGLYLDNQLQEAGDFSGGKGHHRILESREIDFAVLETARGAATGFGLMFDHCELAVCTNVSADHLGERGIDTVDQMAELKLWIVQRARDSVVLNADNAYSAAMLPKLPGRKAWLVSERDGAEKLRARFGTGVGLCVAQPLDGEEWICLFDRDRQIPVMPVAEIPSTLGGFARFNVSNALQAVAASCQMGVHVEVIRKALAKFTNDFENSPGRLNFYDDLPFKVLFDFAHNNEGHRALRSVVDGMRVAGRKVLLLRRRGNTSDEELFGLTCVVASGYDLFVCCDHGKLMGRTPGEVPALLRKGLVRNGIDEACVIEADKKEAIDVALRLCRPGDFLVITTTTETLHEDWALIISASHSIPILLN